MSQSEGSEIHRIRRILLHDWDPIGISRYENASDEYDRYADHVFAMTQSGADMREVSSYLYDIATNYIGLDYPGLLEKSELAARAIIQGRGSIH
jgi:hypothetical protein